MGVKEAGWWGNFNLKSCCSPVQADCGPAETERALPEPLTFFKKSVRNLEYQREMLVPFFNIGRVFKTENAVCLQTLAGHLDRTVVVLTFFLPTPSFLKWQFRLTSFFSLRNLFCPHTHKEVPKEWVERNTRFLKGTAPTWEFKNHSACC